MSVLQVSDDIHQSDTTQLNRQLCPITPHAVNLCPITYHADNLSLTTRHGKPFAMRVFCSALLCSWQRRQKSKEVRDWSERLSFIFNSLFSSHFLFEISKLLFSHFLALRTRHLEPWNTTKIFHIWQPLTQLSFDPFRTREYRENCFYSLDWKEMRILSWNINGIRAARRDKSLKEVLDSLEADVICLQETKVTRE